MGSFSGSLGAHFRERLDCFNDKSFVEFSEAVKKENTQFLYCAIGLVQEPSGQVPAAVATAAATTATAAEQRHERVEQELERHSATEEDQDVADESVIAPTAASAAAPGPDAYHATAVGDCPAAAAAEDAPRLQSAVVSAASLAAHALVFRHSDAHAAPARDRRTVRLDDQLDGLGVHRLRNERAKLLGRSRLPRALAPARQLVRPAVRPENGRHAGLGSGEHAHEHVDGLVLLAELHARHGHDADRLPEPQPEPRRLLRCDRWLRGCRGRCR